MESPCSVTSTPACFNFSTRPDRKSTRLNSSHQIISYAVFCLKKKKTKIAAFPSTSARFSRVVLTGVYPNLTKVSVTDVELSRCRVAHNLAQRTLYTRAWQRQ